jgi:single-strand DNA-binding protein
MSGETVTTVVGNLTADPELRFTQSGLAVANFTVASTTRTGRLRQRSFETKDGDRRTVIELEVDEIGPSLRYATAKVTKVTRTGSATEAPGDPWAADNTRNEEPPF